jgi:hypothetical protein
VIRFFLLPLTRQPTTTATTFERGNEINQTAMHLHFLNPTGTHNNPPAACVMVSAVQQRRRSGRHHPANVVVRRRVCHKQHKTTKEPQHISPLPAEIECQIKWNIRLVLIVALSIAAHVFLRFCCV